MGLFAIAVILSLIPPEQVATFNLYDPATVVGGVASTVVGIGLGLFIIAVWRGRGDVAMTLVRARHAMADAAVFVGGLMILGVLGLSFLVQMALSAVCRSHPRLLHKRKPTQ